MISSASWNKEANQANSLQDGAQNYAKKIVLANKGETGYMSAFDLDQNGIITLDEFNKYCEENGVGEEDKLKLMLNMQSAKIKQKLAKQEEEKDDKRIYAKKGEEKYVEEMDENKDSIVTYDEYIKYCEEYANSKAEKKDEKDQMAND